MAYPLVWSRIHSLVEEMHIIRSSMSVMIDMSSTDLGHRAAALSNSNLRRDMSLEAMELVHYYYYYYYYYHYYREAHHKVQAVVEPGIEQGCI